MSRVPGIANRPEVANRRTASVSELVHIELAEEHCPGRLEAPHDLRILCRNTILEQTAACGRTHSSRIDQILQRNRDAMEGTSPAVLMDFRLGLPGFCQRGLGRDGNKGVQLRIDPLNSAKTRLGQLDRRYFFFPD